jgi:hypothetical protein
MLCPNCREKHHEVYTKEFFDYKDMQKDMIMSLVQIVKLCEHLKLDNVAVSGSYAVHMFQTLHNFRPNWKPSDIDIYCNEPQNLKMDKIQLIDDKVLTCTKEYNSLYTRDTYHDANNSIKSVHKCDLHELSSNNMFTKIQSFDFIHVELSKPYRVIDEFDLDCCKVAITFTEKGIKMHIHNSFYVDSYVLKTPQTTIPRIQKYRARGFICANIDGYDEKALDAL